MRTANFALLLHAHLPFVRHPEYDDFLEEDWLYEAVFETYLPLLTLLRQLAVEEISAPLSLTLTPTLCEMLQDPLLQERTCRYLRRGHELAARESRKAGISGEHRALVEFYRDRFEKAIEFYDRELKRDIVGAFAELQNDNRIEIITCSATHAFLPMLQDYPEVIRAQVLVARDSYRSCFGRDPQGIWLPECAYVEAVLPVLQSANIRWFVIDSHGAMLGRPRPRFAIFSPYYTPHGPAFFARDRDSSRQVWSSREGYPGDPAYRDFYQDLGFSLPLNEIREVYGAESPSRFTGIKLHRITGATSNKEYYRRDWAAGAVDAHATDFLHSRMRQLAELRGLLPVDPIVLSPFDAELFGHWWFEGPEFLNLFLRKAVFDQQVFRLTTPSQYLHDHPTLQIIKPSFSSWGHKGYGEVWLNETNAWIYPHLHAAAETMSREAQQFAVRANPMQDRVLRQMARELMLAQSSDWAFLMKTGTASTYATRRTKDHLLRFNKLARALRSNNVDEVSLEGCEKRNNIFKDLRWQYFSNSCDRN